MKKKAEGGGNGGESGVLHLHAWLPVGPVSMGFIILILIATILSTRLTNVSLISGDSFRRAWSYASTNQNPPHTKFEYSINCSSSSSEGNMTIVRRCPVRAVPEGVRFDEASSGSSCPEYFRWIYEDLKPWRKSGITREMVERAKTPAHIRIIVVDGKVYTEKYKWVYQTRDVFTIWGILQLLRMYPDKLPDLDLMFECGDKPVIRKDDYPPGPYNATAPPPLFHYCGDNQTLDIAFPDWSFWGWPEIHIKPWNALKEDLKEGNKRVKWADREPYAYWRGNIKMGVARQELSKCSNTNQQDWNARIYNMDWVQEVVSRFKSSDLSTQCTHKYKIYVEGVSWSVSEKYILACDSVTLLVKPQYYDFFTRNLQPLVHYWPIKLDDMCKSIKFATEWLGNHTQKAEEIGKAGSSFVQEELSMKNVYDYMFHLFLEYAKLLKYKPSVPPGAVEVCPETMVCPVKGSEKKYMLQSKVKTPSDTPPCVMPPPYHHAQLSHILHTTQTITKKVELLENNPSINLEPN